MKKTVSITYEGVYSPPLDNLIEQAMTSIGGKLTGRGYDFQTSTRDMTFEVPVKNPQLARAKKKAKHA